MVRSLLFLVLIFALPACSAKPDEQVKASLDQLAVPVAANQPTGSTVSMMPRAFAVLPPEAGPPRSVAQREFSDGIAQEIFYDRALPGLNESRIELRIRTAARLDGEPLTLEKPTEPSIRSELESQFPRMTMQVVERPMKNAYGPYGLAVGRWANGARCIYAWQWIDSIPGNSGEAAANPVSIRIRLCRNGASLDQMAALADALRIEPGPYERWERNTVTLNSPAPAAIVRPASITPRKRSKSVNRTVGTSAPQATRPPDVAKPGERGVDAPLDPSLPAAAYRGPLPAQVRWSAGH